MVNQAISLNYDYDNDESCCPFPKIILNSDAYWVCVNCGCVHRREYSNQELRAYSPEEINNRRRTEPIWRSFGSRTVFGNYNIDNAGKQLVASKKVLFARLNRIQNSLVNSLERNYWESKPKLMTAVNKLNLPSFIQETAWKIYTAVVKMKLTQGRSINAFIAASLYVAIRTHEFPRLLEEVVDITQVPVRDIHKAVVMIIRFILPSLQLRYKQVSPEPLLYRFGNELGLSMPIQQKAYDMLRYVFKHGFNQGGIDPKGLAAATIYLAARETEERRTQSQVSAVAQITEVTLRTRSKQLIHYLKNFTPIKICLNEN